MNLPTLDPRRPTVPDVLPLVHRYVSKSENLAGGSLHIILDDGNVRDCDITFCLTYALTKGDLDGAVLALVLLSMSHTQRRKVCRLRYRK